MGKSRRKRTGGAWGRSATWGNELALAAALELRVDAEEDTKLHQVVDRRRLLWHRRRLLRLVERRARRRVAAGAPMAGGGGNADDDDELDDEI